MTSIDYFQSEVQEKKNNNNSSLSKDRNMGDVFSKDTSSEFIQSNEVEEGAEVISESHLSEDVHFVPVNGICGKEEISQSLDDSDNYSECPVTSYQSIEDELFSLSTNPALINHIYTSYKDCPDEHCISELCTCEQEKAITACELGNSFDVKGDEDLDNIKPLSEFGFGPLSDNSTFYDDFKSAKENCHKSDISSELSVCDDDTVAMMSENNDNLHLYSCDYSAQNRNIYANNIEGRTTLCSIWHELQHGLRVIYMNAFDGTDEARSKTMFQPDINRLRELVGRFHHHDAHLLFKHLKSLVQEFVLEIKVKLVYQLRRDVKLPILAQQFLKSLLDCYEKLWLACVDAFPAMHVFEIDHLSHYNISWELLNKYLYLAHVYADPMIRNNLPVFISQLRALLSTSEHQRVCTKLVQRYLSFDEEMNEIGAKWREAEILINAYNQEQATLRAQQKILQTDPDFFRAHGKMLKQQYEGLEDFSSFIETGHDLTSSGQSSHHFSSTLKDFLFSDECPDCHVNKCFCEDCFFNHMVSYAEKLQSDCQQGWTNDKERKSGLKRKHKDEYNESQQAKPEVELVDTVDGQSCECHVCTALPHDDSTSLRLPESFDVPVNPGSLHLYPHIHGSSNGPSFPPLCDLLNNFDSKLPVDDQVDVLDTAALYDDPKLFPGTIKKFWKQFYIDSIADGLSDVNFDLDGLDEKIDAGITQPGVQCSPLPVTEPPVGLKKTGGTSRESWCVKAKKKSQSAGLNARKMVTDIQNKVNPVSSQPSEDISDVCVSDIRPGLSNCGSLVSGTLSPNNGNQSIARSLPVTGSNLKCGDDGKKLASSVTPPPGSISNGMGESDSSAIPETEDSSSQDDSSSSSGHSTSTASTPKDPRHCDCCHCEVFGHGLQSVAPVSRNYPEMRERLRLLLSKKRAMYPLTNSGNSQLASGAENGTSKSQIPAARPVQQQSPSDSKHIPKTSCRVSPINNPCERHLVKRDNHSNDASKCMPSDLSSSSPGCRPPVKQLAGVTKSDQSSQTEQPSGHGLGVRKKVNLVAPVPNPAPVKSPPKDSRSLDMLLNYIEGHTVGGEETEKKSKKAAKRARQRQRKMEEQAHGEDKQKSEVTITLVKHKEKGSGPVIGAGTQPVSFSSKEFAEQFIQSHLTKSHRQLPQGSQVKVKLSSLPGNAQPSNKNVQEITVPKKLSKAAKKKLKEQQNAETAGGEAVSKSGSVPVDNPQMVTIRRVMEPNSQEPTVTITLKGETPAQDKVLFTLVNGQVQNESSKSGKASQSNSSTKGKADKSKKNNSNNSKNQKNQLSNRQECKDVAATKKSKKQKQKSEEISVPVVKDQANVPLADNSLNKQKGKHTNKIPDCTKGQGVCKAPKGSNKENSSSKKGNKGPKGEEKDEIDEILESLLEVCSEEKKKKKKKKKKKPEQPKSDPNCFTTSTITATKPPVFKLTNSQFNSKLNGFQLPYQDSKRLQEEVPQSVFDKVKSICDGDDILRNLRLPPGTTITKIQGPAKPSRTVGKPQAVPQQAVQPPIPGSNFITVPSVLGGGQQQSVIVVDTTRLREDDKPAMSSSVETKSSKSKKEKKKNKKNKVVETAASLSAQGKVEGKLSGTKEDRKILEPMLNLSNYSTSSLFDKVEVMGKVRQNGVCLGNAYPGEHSLKLLTNDSMSHPGNGYLVHNLHSGETNISVNNNSAMKKSKKKKKKNKSKNTESQVNGKEVSDAGEKDEFEKELEAFKRFCFSSYPVERREKVNLNVQDIKELLMKKKSVSWNN